MTSLETVTTTFLTPVVAEHLVINDAVSHALRRDLGRLTRVLGGPVTAVRRDALIRHVTFLIDQLAEHHRLQDSVFWPAAAAAGLGFDDLRDLGERARRSHERLAAPLRRVRTTVLDWKLLPHRRDEVLSAVRELSIAVETVLEQDAELLPLACAALTTVTTGASATDRGALDLRVAPTRSARRVFWLLDDLDPRLADLLLRRIPRAAMWVLRNGFSGGYNRSAYLMWVGGGNGPAV